MQHSAFVCYLRLTLVIAFTAMLNACLHTGGWGGSESPSNLDGLQYHKWLGSAGTEDLKRELSRLENTQSDSHIPFIQLALLLSASKDSTPESEARALSMLSSLSFGDQLDDYQLLASIWINHLELRQAWRAAKADSADNQALAKKLQHQIDALTSIEEQMLQKEQPLLD